MASREMQSTRGSFKIHPARLGAVLAFIGVGLGAFGAHSLEGILTPERLETFETGVRYQMYHALALLAIGALPVKAHRAALFIFVGSLIFSGSLYILVLSGISWLGAITPIGGVLQLIGWALLFVSLGKQES